jgi:translocation and assembly module TamB
MAEEQPKSSRTRRLAVQGAFGLLVLALFVSTAWYLTSPQFRDYVRGRLVARLQEVTGGRVEIGSFQWNLSRLEFDVHDITIHGNEGPGEVPYAHADRLTVQATILSALRRDIALRSVQLERPVIHIIVYPDGHTNQPTPLVASSRTKDPVQSLFELAVRRLDINNGEFILNEQGYPLDLHAQDLKASMEYVGSGDRFDGKISLANLDAKYAPFIPAKVNADLAFSLFRNQLEIRSLHVASAGSKLEATGRLTDFSHATLDVQYRASIDAAEMAKIAKSRSVRNGQLDIEGSARFSPSTWNSTGRVVAHSLDYRTGEIDVPNLNGAAQFNVDADNLTFSNVVARLFGGIFRGDVKIANWSNPGPAKNSGVQTGVANLRIESFPIGTLAGTFSSKKFNFGRLNLAGVGRGSLRTEWKGSIDRAVASVQLSVTPPDHPGENQMPVTADLDTRMDLGSGAIQLNSFNASLPEMHLTAAGAIGKSTDHIRLSLQVSDMTRLRPVLVALNEWNSTTADLAGKVVFDGTVAGTLSAPLIEGRVKVSDFSFPLSAVLSDAALEANSQSKPQRIQIDSGTANLAYSHRGITIRNGELRRAGAQANFDLSAILTKGELTDASSITAHLAIRDASLADLQQFAGYNYPITGVVAANLDISGMKGNPQGGGHVELVNATAYGEPIKSASADIRIQNQEARVQNFRLLHNGAQVNGAGVYNLKSSAFQFNLVGNNFDLARIRRANSGKGTIAGALSFNANGSGTVQSPIINASARFQNLVVNGQRVGDATLMAVTQGDALRVTGRSNFRNAELTTDGTIKIQDHLFPANITVRFSNFDFVPFLQPLFQGKLTGKSYVGGSVTVQGPLRQPRNLTVLAEIPTLRAAVQGIELSNPEPIRANMMNQVVQIESFRLVGQDTEMNARGRIDLTADPRFRVRANGRMNLKLIQSLNPDMSSEGLIDFNMNLGGLIKKPTMQGEIRITNGSFNLIDFPNGLSNVNGSLLFTEDRVQVQSLTAHTGGGDIKIGGYATYSPQVGFNLTATGEDIRLRYPPGVSSTANLDLTLTGTLNNSLLSGDVTVTRFGLNSQVDLALLMAKSNRPPDTPHASPLNNLRLNVHVVSTPELQVQSSLGKLAGNVDLNVRGVGTNPVILGRISATEGQLSFNGQNYRLERGDVTFSNPAKTEPTIDVEATTRVRDYDLTVRLVGQPARGLKPTFRSDPPLPDADIVNLLAFGRTREETQIASTLTSTGYTNTVSEAVLGQAINTAVSSRVQRLFGVSRVRISPDLSSSTQTTNPSAQVTVEQSVSDKVTITYITNLAQSSQQAISVEYYLNRDVSLIAGRDQYGVVSFDIRIRQRKR